MRTLYHLPLSPFCRKVRLALGEKRLEFALAFEPAWEKMPEFMSLNPAGTVPVMIDEDGTVVIYSHVIIEYLEETYPGTNLIPAAAAERVEARRLAAWFDEKFHAEVTTRMLYEKMSRRHGGPRAVEASPSMASIREGMSYLRAHLDLIGALAEHRRWLAGDTLSIADLAAASHLSCLDYLGDVPWSQYEAAKEWYVRLKSRPSFRPLLNDIIPGMPPTRYYPLLDF
jgi:glutathione S-transferase